MAIREDIELEEQLDLEFPKRYKVYLLNDDYTDMDFVIEILMHIFHKNYDEAKRIMLLIHEKGQGLCGIYTYEIAQTKVTRVHKIAKKRGYPLRAIMEEE